MFLPPCKVLCVKNLQNFKSISPYDAFRQILSIDTASCTPCFVILEDVHEEFSPTPDC